MITFVVPQSLYESLNLGVIIRKIEYARENESMKYHLRALNFDHRFTKPLSFSGWDILDILYKSKQVIFIKRYSQNYFAWKFVPVNAYKPADRVDCVFVNSRQMWRSKQEWEETIWHELVHIADHLSLARFDHGDNDLSGKDESAPVKFAKIMAAMTLPDTRKEKMYV